MQNQPAPVDLESVALEYLDRGWSVIPIRSADKRPLIKWQEFQQRLATEEEVADWFSRWPDAQLGLVTGAISGVVAIDPDSPGARSYCEANGLASPVRNVAARGPHYLFRHPGTKVDTGKNVWGVQNLDVRGDGGYIVIAPSTCMSKAGTLHTYYLEADPGFDLDELPEWPGQPRLINATKLTPQQVDEYFQRGQLPPLGGVVAKHPDDYLSIWDRTAKSISLYGKMPPGSGRGTTLTVWIGECVASGIVGEALVEEVRRFQDEFFAEDLEEREWRATIRSVIDKDRREHPERWDALGNPIAPAPGALPTVIAQPPAAPALIAPEDIDDLRAALASTTYLIDPWLMPETIVQVHGYTGAGKSLWLMLQLWAMAAGHYQNIGPMRPRTRSKVLYFDFENPAFDLLDRMAAFRETFGNPGPYFRLWSASLMREDIDLYSETGRDRMEDLIKEYEPDVVVIDTIRSAWRGIEEGKAEAWAPVNTIAKTLRDAGMTVILVHHSNKPQDGAIGREAGSTNQLTLVDVQIQVIQCYRDEDLAKRRGGLVRDQEIEARMLDTAATRGNPIDFIQTFWAIQYGKVRRRNENMVDRYMAITDHDDGMMVLGESSPRSLALWYYSQRNMRDAAQISRALNETHELFVSAATIRRWIDEDVHQT